MFQRPNTDDEGNQRPAKRQKIDPSQESNVSPFAQPQALPPTSKKPFLHLSLSLLGLGAKDTGEKDGSRHRKENEGKTFDF